MVQILSEAHPIVKSMCIEYELPCGTRSSQGSYAWWHHAQALPDSQLFWCWSNPCNVSFDSCSCQEPRVAGLAPTAGMSFSMGCMRCHYANNPLYPKVRTLLHVAICIVKRIFFTIGWVKLKIGTKVQTIEELIWGFLFSSIHLSEGQNYGDLAQLLQECSFLQFVCCWC